MACFLDLPVEIRALIIAEVLFDVRPPPREPSYTNREIFPDSAYKAWVCNIYQENLSTPSLLASLSLLLTSRQISTETKAILNLHTPGRSTAYHLDISFLNEVDLFPTWLSIPSLTTHVSTLHASVRLFGHIISYVDARVQAGSDGHAGFQWNFYALLERFLAYGPVGRKREPENETPDPQTLRRKIASYTRREVTIGTLILDFSSAEQGLPYLPDFEDSEDPDMPEALWFNQQYADLCPPHAQRSLYSDWQPDIDIERYKARPQWVANWLIDELGSLLDLSSTTASYGAILYERIGAVRILVDGQPYHEMDLSQELIARGSRRKRELSVREIQALREKRFG